nr:hypothetical protein [uncultured Acetobacterium sp.]
MMKNSYLLPVTLVIMTLSLGLMFINRMILPMPDWVVRSNGIIMLISLAALSYSTAKLTSHKKEKGDMK